ncbi:hypothetical protein UJ101_01003 [Flavobacteriaceae bacterium UJ101]|nr:hypothetical protein UJ101_01003 [Flavobacteriaceae bacterium UJ101]
MDSLTQIVLGAACGEVALGKKIGNKAMLWGAIGGTIPDLDVFVRNWIYDDAIHREAFHRGFMHSILFAVLMSILLAIYFKTLHPYVSYYIRKMWFWIKKSFVYVYNKIFNKNIVLEIPIRKDYPSFKDWWWLWFLSIFTHPILDCFTAYGTQLFAPFSNYRVAFNNIAVVDPLYTLPFLLFLILAMFFKRTSQVRKTLVWMGIGISSAYMLFTVFNKFYVDDVFEKNLKEQNIPYERFTSTPTLFNNILWWGTAETEDAFYMGEYSIFDSQPISFIRLEKNHQLLGKYDDTEEMQIMKWFTFGYYTLQELEKDKYRLNYIKYGLRENDGKQVPVFGFDLMVDNGKISMLEYDPEDDMTEGGQKSFWEAIKKELGRLWTRMQGN